MHEPIPLLQQLGFDAVEPLSTPLGGLLYAAVDPDGRPVLVAYERAHLAGARSIESAFSRGWLRLCAFRGRQAGAAVVVTQARSLSAATEAKLRHFVDAVTGGSVAAWLVTDGERVIASHGIEGGRSGRGARGRASAVSPSSRRRGARSRRVMTGVWTDASLRCVQEILAVDVPRRGDATLPPSEPVAASADVLAHRAGVSLAHAYRFIEAYHSLGFLRTDGRCLRLCDRYRLLKGFADRIGASLAGGTRTALSVAPIESWLSAPQLLPLRSRHGEAPREGERFALGAHHAAACHGVPVAAGAPLLLYVDGAPSDVAERLDLDLDVSTGWNVLLVNPRYPRCVWEGAIGLDDPSMFPRVDVVCSYLDLLAHPLRGTEGAKELVKRWPALEEDSTE